MAIFAAKPRELPRVGGWVALGKVPCIVLEATQYGCCKETNSAEYICTKLIHTLYTIRPLYDFKQASLRGLMPSNGLSIAKKPILKVFNDEITPIVFMNPSDELLVKIADLFSQLPHIEATTTRQHDAMLNKAYDLMNERIKIENAQFRPEPYRKSEGCLGHCYAVAHDKVKKYLEGHKAELDKLKAFSSDEKKPQKKEPKKQQNPHKK